MKTIRERFEEIWPVPEGVIWDGDEYLPEDDLHMAHQKYFELAAEHDARLDTFTRCQETTDVYVSLIDEMVSAMDDLIHYTHEAYSPTLYAGAVNYAKTTIDRAKQIMEQKK